MTRRNARSTEPCPTLIGILVIDERGLVQEANDQAAVMLARPLPELLGHPVQLPLIDSLVAEVPIHWPDGETRWATMRGSNIHRVDGDARLVILSDLAPSHDPPKGTSTGDENNLLLSVGRAAAKAAHEINNALGTLLSYTMLVGDSTAALREFVAALDEAASEQLGAKGKSWLANELREHEVRFILHEMDEMLAAESEAVERISRLAKSLTRRGQASLLAPHGKEEGPTDKA